MPPENARPVPTIPRHVHDILDDNPTGFLATVRPDGELSVTPLAVLFDGQTIRLSTTTDRRKYRNLRVDPRVALCVPHRNNPNRYVEIRGTAILHPDPDRTVINAIATKYMHTDVYPFDPPGTERVTIEIVPHQVSAPTIPLARENPNGPDAVDPGQGGPPDGTRSSPLPAAPPDLRPGDAQSPWSGSSQSSSVASSQSSGP